MLRAGQSCRLRRARWPCFFYALLIALLSLSAQGQPSGIYRQKTRTFHTADEFARTRAGKVQIQRRVDPQSETALRQLPVRLPVSQFTVIGIESPSVTWVGSPHGAVRVSRD